MFYNAVNTGKRIQKLRKGKSFTQEQLAEKLRAYPQISNCGIIATKGGGKNGRKELQVMDNIRCVLGGHKG